MTKKVECVNCDFYEKDDSSCRFSAPTLLYQSFSRWPKVHENDWCGEFVHTELLIDGENNEFNGVNK